MKGVSFFVGRTLQKVYMDLDDLVQTTFLEYEGSTDYPVDGDDDYAVYTGLFNSGIRVHSQIEDVDWKEYIKDVSDSDGDKVADGTTQIDAPTDFVRPLNWIVTIDSNNQKTYWNVIPANRSSIKKRAYNSPYICWVTGKKKAYKINFSSAPTSGHTISYEYIKEPSFLSVTTDVPEMSKPLFLVYFALEKLYIQDNRNDMITYYSGLKEDVMSSMLIDNEVMPVGNQTDIPDEVMEVNGFVWGE